MTRRTDMCSEDPMQCEKCGRPHATKAGGPSCTAHRRDDQPCGNNPMRGQSKCRMHGGKSRGAEVNGERRQQDAAVLAAATTYGLAVDVSPADALLEEVRWTAGHVQWLRARVQELEQQPVWGTTKTKTEAAGGTRITFGGPEADDEDEPGLVDVGAVPASEVT